MYTKQWTTNGYIKLEYDYQTDVFKDYGFSTCLKLSPNPSVAVADKQFMAYSYLTDKDKVYGIGKTFTVSFYAYVSEDCNVDFNLYLEHDCRYVNVYKDYNKDYNKYYNKWLISDTTKGKVFFVWATFTANATDGKIYLMFYPNPNQTNVFTKGYYLIAGIDLHEGSKIYRPSSDGNSHGIISIPNSMQITENNIIFDDFIEY